MHQRPYNFNHFLQEVADGDRDKILSDAQREVERIERSMYGGGRGSVQQRERGGGPYVHRIKQFIYFVGKEKKPSSVEESDFQAYRPVAEILVRKGQFKPETLQLFQDFEQ